MRVVACVICLVAIALGQSCCSPSKEGSKTDRATLVGLWFPTPELKHADWPTSPFGYIFEVPPRRELSPKDPEAALTHLARAPIAAAFRSNREGVAAAQKFSADGREVRWFCATFQGGWLLDPSPLSDDNLVPPGQPPFPPEPLGAPDAGLKTRPKLWLLPPPLQQRGLALAQSNPVANAAMTMRPGDCSRSIFISWDDIEKRVRGAEMYVWRDGAIRRADWAAREQFQQPPLEPTPRPAE
jgi:hypothetical protein